MGSQNAKKLAGILTLAAMGLAGWCADAAVADVITITGDALDGSIYSGGGHFEAQNLIVGTAAGNVQYNGIAAFRLPDLGGGSLSAASLSFTVMQGGTLGGPNADLWGLGYVAGTTTLLNGGWLLTADTDTRTGTTLGTNIGSNTPTKIADNFAGTSLGSNAVLSTDADPLWAATLVSFLNSLYAQGAQPGDLAIFRINQDSPTNSADTSKNYRFAASNYTTSSAWPTLSIAVAPIPEPAAAGLLGVGVLTLVHRRRK